MSIAENLKRVLQEIAQATTAAQRPNDAVKLIAVSKTKPIADVRAAMQAGQIDFGENKVQEMVEKQAALPDVRWHMIGNLQRNKVKYIAPFVYLIHSIDDERLLAEVDRQAKLHGRIVNCLLQINISDEEQKGGFDEAEAEALLAQIGKFPNVRILGLMGMAAFTDDLTIVQSQFERLARAKASFQKWNGPQVEITELSMGMSGDFATAIAAGSTMVRIGGSIFGYR